MQIRDAEPNDLECAAGSRTIRCSLINDSNLMRAGFSPSVCLNV
jgi:hypothetical protein